MTSAELVTLKQRIWVPDAARPLNLLALVDAARSEAAYDLVQKSYRKKSCLFAGTLPVEMERAAPYLVELGPRDTITDTLLSIGWDDSWGVLIDARTSFESLRTHLRQFVRVQDEAGRSLLFRFYDPRVLTLYLPTCTPAELNSFFGDAVARFIARRTQDGSTCSYSWQDDGLRVTHLLDG